MNLRQYITFFAVGTAIGWCAWFLVLMSIDPVEAGLVAYLMFYVSLVIGLSGLLTTVSTLVRVIRYPDRDAEEIVHTSLRQGFLLTLLVVGSLILLSLELFTWWTLVLVVMIVGLLEFLFTLSTRKKKK